MLLGLGAGSVVVEHDHRGLLRMLAGIFPALHRGFHKAGHDVDESGIGQALLEHVETVFHGGDALLFILEDHQILRLHAGVDDLPVLVVGHGRDAVGLLLQQRIDVEALLEDLDAVVAAIGRNAEFRHPGEEGILVAEEPDAESLAAEILRRR